MTMDLAPRRNSSRQKSVSTQAIVLESLLSRQRTRSVLRLSILHSVVNPTCKNPDNFIRSDFCRVWARGG